GDSIVRVAFQATLSLGEFSGPETVDALAKVVEQYGQNSWFKTAVLSSESGSSLELLQKLIADKIFFEGAEEGRLSFLEDFSHVIGSRNQADQVNTYLDLLSSKFGNQEEWQRAGINGLIKGFGKSWSPEQKEALKSQEDYAGMAVKEVID